MMIELSHTLYSKQEKSIALEHEWQAWHNAGVIASKMASDEPDYEKAKPLYKLADQYFDKAIKVTEVRAALLQG
jgi:hypothetical protein